MTESLPAGTVEIDGVEYSMANWSQSGFLAEAYTGDRKTRDKVEVKVRVPLGDGTYEFTTMAMLVRVDHEAQKAVGAFVDMETSLRVEIARRFST